MPVAGLVLNFSENREIMQETLSTIDADRNFSIGTPPVPTRVPVVMESEDDAQSRRQLSWLQQLPGVRDVHVVSVDYSDQASPPPGGSNHSLSDSDKGATSS